MTIYVVETKCPDGSWEPTRTTHLSFDAAEQQLNEFRDDYPGDEFRVAEYGRNEPAPLRKWVAHTIRDNKVYGGSLVEAATPEEAVAAEKKSLEEYENGKAGWHHKPGDFWPRKPGDYYAVTLWQDEKAEPDPAYT